MNGRANSRAHGTFANAGSIRITDPRDPTASGDWVSAVHQASDTTQFEQDGVQVDDRERPPDRDHQWVVSAERNV